MHIASEMCISEIGPLLHQILVQKRPNFTFIWAFSVLGQPAVSAQLHPQYNQQNVLETL